MTTSRLVIDEDSSVSEMVTVRDKSCGVTIDTRITEAKVICEYGMRKIEGEGCV